MEVITVDRRPSAVNPRLELQIQKILIRCLGRAGLKCSVKQSGGVVRVELTSKIQIQDNDQGKFISRVVLINICTIL